MSSNRGKLFYTTVHIKNNLLIPLVPNRTIDLCLLPDTQFFIFSSDSFTRYRERYTPGLWFLPPDRQVISKEHQLRVAQDQKPSKKMMPISLPYR
jgi:hypothetical protein